MPDLCFIPYFSLPLNFASMGLPGGLSGGRVLCLNTYENLLVPCALAGGDFWGDFCFKEGKEEWNAFFSYSAQLVVPYWVVFVLQSHGKGGCCQCLLITYSDMTGRRPFTGPLQCCYPNLLPEMESISPEQKLLFFANAGFMLNKHIWALLLLKIKFIWLFNVYII